MASGSLRINLGVSVVGAAYQYIMGRYGQHRVLVTFAGLF